jgi:hypothetical protein
MVGVLGDTHGMKCGCVFDAVFNLLLNTLASHLDDDEFQDACLTYAQVLTTLSAKSKDAN